MIGSAIQERIPKTRLAIAVPLVRGGVSMLSVCVPVWASARKDSRSHRGDDSACRHRWAAARMSLLRHGFRRRR